MVRLIGDDDSSIRWHIAQPPQPVQLSGQPLFRVRSVDFEVGSSCATLRLDCGYIDVTAERVSIEVVDWLRLQGPDQRVTLGQLYSPVPKKGAEPSLPLTPEMLGDYLNTDELALAAFRSGMSQADLILLLLSSRAALLDSLKQALLANPPSVVFSAPAPEGSN
jgi:hypothetical protein